MGTLSDSDPDFWDLGDDEGAAPHKRRGRPKKNKGFSDFPINVADSGEKLKYIKEHSRERREESRLIEDCDERASGDEGEDEDSNEEEESDDEEHDNEDKEREEGSGNSSNNSSSSSSSSSSDTSKRTSLLTGSELPHDSSKDAVLTDEPESSKSSKGSSNQSQWLVEEYLLPPQQKLKLALYRGRKLLNAGEGDGAVREFVRAQALARVVHGDQHWRYCRCKVFLAKAYLYLKEYAPQGEAQAKEALETLNTHLSTDLAPSKKPQVHHTLLWGHLVCGEARIKLGQLPGAQESLGRALYHTRIYARMVSRWKKQLSPSLTIDRPLDLQVKVLCAQAALYIKQKKHSKAREKLEASIALIEKEGSGGEDPGLVGPLQQLGRLLLDRPQADLDHSAGLEYLARAVHITQVSNRPGSVAECEARGLLLEHQLRLHRVETPEALRELHKLGILFSRLQGEHSPRTTAIHNLTVQVLVQEEDYPQAIQHLTARLKHCRDAHGDYSPQVCGVLKQLSRVHALSGDLSGAALALDQCLQAEVLIYGTSSRRAQASRLRLQEMIQKLPLSLRMKLWRKHPELQNKPRFRNL